MTLRNKKVMDAEAMGEGIVVKLAEESEEVAKQITCSSQGDFSIFI